MNWTGTERRIHHELRATVSQLSMRLGISQREAYKLIKDKHLKKSSTE